MIRPLIRRLRQRICRAMGHEDGNATIEFVILFPVFMTIFLSVFESGLLMTRYMMLERGLDITVRAIRLSTGTPVTHDQVRDSICKLALILPDCANAMKVELDPINTSTWAMPARAADCIDRGSTTNKPANFTPGTSNGLMYVRACIVVDPWFPGTGLGLQLPKDSTGGYQMVATSAFVYEPK